MAAILRRIPHLFSQRCHFVMPYVRGFSACLPQPSVASLSPALSSKLNGILLKPQFRPEPLCIRLMSSEKLTPEKVTDRVMSCLKLYDKIKPDLLTEESHFMKDLGLDSLDHVEIIVAIENEFALEIPDDAAETLLTPNEIVKYICKSSEM